MIQRRARRSVYGSAVPSPGCLHSYARALSLRYWVAMSGVYHEGLLVNALAANCVPGNDILYRLVMRIYGK